MDGLATKRARGARAMGGHVGEAGCAKPYNRGRVRTDDTGNQHIVLIVTTPLTPVLAFG